MSTWNSPWLSHLIISEVFFDGSDERIEIANIGSAPFSGLLTIKGVKSNDLLLNGLSIPTGSAYVRWDTLAQIVDKTIVKWAGLGFSISDTSALNISLFASDQLLDSFVVDAPLLSALPNNYWFEKVRSWDQLTILPTAPERVHNINWSRIANPWKIRTIFPVDTSTSVNTGNSTTGTTTTDSATTGEVLSTGQNTDWTIESSAGVLSITEIHPGNDTLQEYIELHFMTLFSGALKITWLGAGSAAKTLTFRAIAGQYIILADTLLWFLDSSPVTLVDSISLTDGGETITITDLSGRLYSSAIYTGSIANHSRYAKPSDSSGGSISNEFSQSGFMSPWFSEKAFSYLPASLGVVSSDSVGDSDSSMTKAESNSYYQALYKKRKDRYYDLKAQIALFGLAINKAGAAYRKWASSAVELVDDTEEFTEADPLSAEVFSTLQISAVLPDATWKDANSEQIRITLLSGNPVDLQDFVIHVNTKKTFLAGLLSFPGDSLTAKWEFGLVNKPACITLEQHTVVYDTFCYGQPKAGHRITTTGDISDDPAFSGLQDLAWMKKVRLSILTGEACALFGDSSFLCIPTKGIIDPKKQEQYDMKLASLQKKFDKKSDQYATLQERYAKTKKELEAKRRKYYEQTKTIRASYKEKLSHASLENKLWKNYGWLLQSEIKKSRPVVRKESHITFLQSLLDTHLQALRTITTGNSFLSLHGHQFAIGDIKKQYAFSTDPAVVADSLIAQALALLSSWAAERRNSWLDQRYSFQQ